MANECFFGRNGYCGILEVVKCPAHCKFKKTEAEYMQANAEAEEILYAKNLEPYAKQLPNGKWIMTVRRINL